MDQENATNTDEVTQATTSTPIEGVENQVEVEKEPAEVQEAHEEVKTDEEKSEKTVENAG